MSTNCKCFKCSYSNKEHKVGIRTSECSCYCVAECIDYVNPDTKEVKDVCHVCAWMVFEKEIAEVMVKLYSYLSSDSTIANHHNNKKMKLYHHDTQITIDLRNDVASHIADEEIEYCAIIVNYSYPNKKYLIELDDPTVSSPKGFGLVQSEVDVRDTVMRLLE